MRARNAYLSNSIHTASGPSLLLMLLDRLRTDVEQALAHQELDDHESASTRLLHAQDIVSELLSSLDVDLCPGGENLAAVYDWILRGLIDANVGRDVTTTRDCLLVVTQVVDVWHEAAAHAAGAAAIA
ncbi:MAG: flagellar export chaperone FliS [Nocardioidaceae bacterium]|nr:flagellar export chaperone FliS [Nocardioidaceae bacterium]